MASETIIVQIDQAQLTAQKNNQYSLYLAKMVNGVYTVIWQSMGPIATVNTPSYEPSNTFNIAVPSYQINYTNVPIVQGSVTFTSSGNPVTMNIGQAVTLDTNGIFGTPTNSGTAGQLTVQNSLAGNPHEILSDANGNAIFVNVASGMDVGPAVLTPIDEYQIWFGNLQETGTIIANNVSNAGTVTFAGGTTTQTISYTNAGTWQSGPLAGDSTALASAVKSADVAVTVVAFFTKALVVGAVTYLASKLIDKFANNLQPTNITVSTNPASVSVTFAGGQGSSDAAANLGTYDAAVNAALNAAMADPSSDLTGESWTFGGQVLEVHRAAA
jgi:hypothetical protein